MVRNQLQRSSHFTLAAIDDLANFKPHQINHDNPSGPEYVDMRGRMIVRVDHHSQTTAAQNRRHDPAVAEPKRSGNHIQGGIVDGMLRIGRQPLSSQTVHLGLARRRARAARYFEPAPDAARAATRYCAAAAYCARPNLTPR